MKEQIKTVLKKAVERLYPAHLDLEFEIEAAPDAVHADFASNIAFVLGKASGEKPIAVAEVLCEILKKTSDFEDVSVAQPGFINFRLKPNFWRQELARILREGEKYGTSGINKGKKARVEYVSANPTGPIHIGNVRGGPFGETICKALEAAGFSVLREYLHNDIGGQVEKLGQTIWYWCQKLMGKDAIFPEDGYKGEYLEEVAKAAMAEFSNKLTEQDQVKLTNFALDYIYRENLETLKRIGIKFDLIVKESELESSGRTKEAIAELKARKYLKDKDGAVWFAPNDEFLADREAVVVKSNGEMTYFASDIAYHKEKFESGYDLVIDIFGSNHHGHVPKLQALTKIFGYPSEQFKVLLYQYVRAKRGQEAVKMSKRAGTFITAKEVLDEVGSESMIFLLLLTAVNTHIDFDLELAKDTSEKNPVFKVQYAFARIASVKRKAESEKYKISASFELLNDPLELGLIRELAKFPELVLEIADTYVVHRLPHYLLGLADKFHQFYEKVRIISDDENLTAARLALLEAAQTVFGNALRLMGIKPREKM